jgi:hypothetical protein
MWVSDIFALSVCLKLTDIFFQIFPLSVPLSSAGLMSYIVQIVSICLTGILQPLHFSLLIHLM